MNHNMYPQRPLGVTLLSLFWLANGLLTVISVLWALVSGGFGFFTVFNLIGGLFALLIAYGLWTLKSWGFWSAALMAAIDVLQGLLALITGSFGISTLIPLAFAVIILAYLFMDRSVRTAFGV